MWHLHLHSRLVKWRSQCTRSLSFTMLREELRQKMHELWGIFFLHSSIIHPYPVFWKTMFPSLFLWMVMVLNISVCTVLSSQRPTACLMINVNPTTVKIYSIILFYYIIPSCMWRCWWLLSTITEMSLISGHSADVTWKNISGHTNNNTVKKNICD